jgi:hypothetical protein
LDAILRKRRSTDDAPVLCRGGSRNHALSLARSSAVEGGSQTALYSAYGFRVVAEPK